MPLFLLPRLTGEAGRGKATRKMHDYELDLI